MEQTNRNYYVQIVDVQKVDFGFFGNECEYTVDVYNAKKKKIGQAGGIEVVQQGTEYDSVHEELYDLCENGDRNEIADFLGVEEVLDDWFDDEAQIDIDKLPQRVQDHIFDQEDSMLLEYYQYEDFAEDADEEGLIPLDVFFDRLTFGRVGRFREIDTDLPLAEMFDATNGWYEPEIFKKNSDENSACHPGGGYAPIDITSDAGKSLFIKTIASVAYHLDDNDYVSALVNIRYEGDYDLEETAREDMNYIYIEIAYIIIVSLLPQINDCSSNKWKATLHKTITTLGRQFGFINSDEEPMLEELYDDVYAGLANNHWPSQIYEEATFEPLVTAFLEQGIYPMAEEKYEELKEDRDILFLDNCIG